MYGGGRGRAGIALFEIFVYLILIIRDLIAVAPVARDDLETHMVGGRGVEHLLEIRRRPHVHIVILIAAVIVFDRQRGQLRGIARGDGVILVDQHQQAVGRRGGGRTQR